MALGKIDHICFYVDDLEKAEEYFTKRLGFKLLRGTEHGRKSIELTSPAGDFFLEFYKVSEERYKAAKEMSPGLPHFSHVAFKVDDINKEVEELISKGVLFKEAPHFNPESGRTLANTSDADGRYWIQLSSIVRLKK